MPIKDGSKPESNQVPPVVQAQIDPHQIASLVRELNKQDVQQAPQESRFSKKINALLGDENNDKANVTELASLFEAQREDIKDEVRKELNQTGGRNLVGQYQDAVTEALEKYTEADEDIDNAHDFLKSKVLEKIQKDSSLMAKFNAGQLDKKAVKDYVKAEVENFNKTVLKRDSAKKGVSMPSGQGAGGTQSQGIETESNSGSIEDITEPYRREAYSKYLSLQMRNKVPLEEAKKKAYEMATKTFGNKSPK